MKSSATRAKLAGLVGRFLGEMHRYDAGRTLPLLHAANVTTPQMAVLEFVRVSRTVSAIADYVGLSRPATSQMIQKLVNRGLVCRFESDADRRERAVLLSGRGKKFIERVAAARAARFEGSLAALPARTAQRLTAALVETVEALNKAASNAGRRGR